MAIIRKKLLAKPSPAPGEPMRGAARMGLSPAGKGKPAPKKPAEKPASKPAAKPAAKPASAPVARAGTAKPAAKSPSAKAPAAKPQKAPPVLNKGALAAKAMAEARVAAAAKAAAEKAEAEAKRPRKLVPATANAIRPGAAKQALTKGKAQQRPPAEVRPLGVLPPEAMAKSKPAVPGMRPSAPLARPFAPTRHVPPTVRPGDTPGLPNKASAPSSARPAKGDERLSETDLKHFETRLLEERARIMREMGHLENTILKVNPRDSAGEVGGYSFHMADAGTDSMEREISFDIASKEGRLLREIDDALRRIYNGVYGICEASGKPIARARLEALPWARYTIEEQHNMELKQRAGRLVKEEE
jgi:RNA polymerase-binding transcription factor DksA